MKRNLLSSIIVITNILFFTSCGESFAPITLVSTDGHTYLTNNDTIYLDAFTAGKDFYIKGGNEKYVLENQDRTIVSYEYNGEKLSLFPNKIGYGMLRITDYEKNESRFTIAVRNQARIFHVNNILSEVIGGELTQNETKDIERDIIDNAIMKVGGSIEFTYTVENLDAGNVTIYPQKGGNAVTGIFSQKESFDPENGYKILSFDITMAGDNKIKLDLIEKDDNCMVLRHDVTEEYKGQYSKLEKATLEYVLDNTSEN